MRAKHISQIKFILLLLLLSPNLFCQEEQSSILKQIELQLPEHKYLFTDSLKASIRVFNYSAKDSLLHIHLTTAQINRLIINGSDTIFAGRFVGRDKRNNKQNDYYSPVLFKANAWTELDILSYNLSDSNFDTKVILKTDEEIKSYLSNWIVNNSRGAFVNVFFLGGVIALLLYFGMLSVLSPRRDFIIYSFYLLFVLLHYLLSTDTNMRLGLFFPNAPINNILINDFTLNMMYTVYIYFAMQFLDVKKHSAFLTKFLTCELVFHFILAVFFTTYLLVTRNLNILRNELYDLYLVAFAFSLVSVALIYFLIPGKVKYFVIIGSLCLSIASFLEVINDTHLYRWFEFREGDHRFLSFNVTQVGIFLELICFSLGIGFKHNKIFQEKEAAQMSYIDQLKKNQQLKDKYTNELQQEVDQQAEELMKEKEKSLKTQFDNRIMQLESEMLLSQMNPHFIFNSLNSIKYYALTQPAESTAKYITDFAKLMRIILQNSRESEISLKEEINFILLYLQLESRRHEDRFTYKLNIDEGLDENKVSVPSMLIQPLVENAFVHGLFHREAPGHVTINFEKLEDQLLVEVIDNGIGRKASEAFKERSRNIKRTSLGNSITKERLSLYNHLYETGATLKVDDLYDDRGEAAGTKVILHLPLKIIDL